MNTKNLDNSGVQQPAKDASDGEPQIDAQLAWQLMRQQKLTTLKQTNAGNSARLLLLWGVAWCIGFSVWHLALSPHSPWRVAMAVAGPVFAFCILGAVVLTIVLSLRGDRGIQSYEASIGIKYGMAWFGCFLPTFVLAPVLARYGVDTQVINLVMTSMSIVIVAAMYFMGGIMWHDTAQYFLAAWLIVALAAGLITGPEWMYLIMALAGGGGMLLSGLVAWFRLSRRVQP